MTDWKKIISCIRIQLVIVVVVGIITTSISYFVFSTLPEIKTLQDLLSLSSNPLLIISGLIGYVSIAAILWAGYTAAKKVKKSVVTGGLAGVIVSLVSSLISTVLNATVNYPLYLNVMSSAGSVIGAPNLESLPSTLGSLMPLGMALAIVSSIISGFILGAIGAFAASKIRAKK